MSTSSLPKQSIMPPKDFNFGLAWQQHAGPSTIGTTAGSPSWVRMLNLESNWDDELLQRLIPSFGWKGDLPNAKAVTEHGKKVGSDGQLAVHARLRRQAMRLPHATVVAHMFKLPVCLSDARTSISEVEVQKEGERDCSVISVIYDL